MSAPETLGSRLKSRRLEKTLSQAKLATIAGVTQGLIGQLESDLNQGSKHLYKIAIALGVNVTWLETGKGEKEVTGSGSTLPIDTRMGVFLQQMPCLVRGFFCAY